MYNYLINNAPDFARPVVRQKRNANDAGIWTPLKTSRHKSGDIESCLVVKISLQDILLRKKTIMFG